MSRFREFWIVEDGDKYPKGTAHLAYSWNHKYGKKIHAVEIAALEQAQEKIKDLEAKLSVAKDYLEKINNEELNLQRPGGGYSKSATLSYEALEKLK